MERLQASIRVEDRLVVQWGSCTPAPQDDPAMEGGVGVRDECVIEEITPDTLAAIHAALPVHGGGVILSADHATVTPAPEPDGYQARAAAAADAEADRALVREQAADHADSLVRALARLAGLA